MTQITDVHNPVDVSDTIQKEIQINLQVFICRFYRFNELRFAWGSPYNSVDTYPYVCSGGQLQNNKL